MKALALVVASQGLLFATGAYANPVAFEVVRIREVPGPHVQLTYAVEASKTPKTPSVPAVFGSKSTPWKTAAYQANTGSGVRALNGIQWRGRRAAAAVGLGVNGSLGLLGRAKHLGLIPAVEPWISKLANSGVHYHPDLLRAFLEGMGE